ncbi:MAG: cell envelope integrity protein CreD [Bacteroidota bacterium]
MNFFDRFNEWVRNSLIVKLLAIGILILLLLIPSSMVESLIREREYNSERVINEVSGLWSHPQQLLGPILTVPYKEYYTNDDGKVLSTTKYANFLPSTLNINGELDNQKRYRSIYEVVVYTSELSIVGNFPRPNFADFKIDTSDVLWDEAYLSVGISDMRGIQNTVKLNWADENYEFSPGMKYRYENNNNNNQYDNYGKPINNNGGISSRLDLTYPKASYTFSFDLTLNGSRNIYFTPVGATTNVVLSSDWQTPSFKGAFLPDERTINEKGFQANWEVLSLNRTYPQAWLGNSYGFSGSQFGVDLLIPVDYYQKSTRSAKYSILFVALTFLIFFFVEVLNGKRIHPIQYILVGLALVLFYTLLLAFSEHIGFAWAYVVSSVAIIGLISLYVSSIFKNSKLTLVTTGILIILYGFIYTLLQLEDYALLLGSIGLFVILGFVMLFTRRIDWYALRNKENSLK